MRPRLPNEIDDLPASLVDVAETLGFHIALALIQNFGGQEIKFPKRPTDVHPVIVALGRDDGHALCKYLGGAAIYVPHRAGAQATRRDVQTLAAAGHSRGAIARRLGISQRWVRALAGSTPDPKQPGLFD